MTPVPLHEATSEHAFGGKARQLAEALRAGLPVPLGVALSVECVERIAAGDARARDLCARALELLGAGRVAVRSSAVGEDGAAASFAGQHLTRLNVTRADALRAAVVEVWESGRALGAVRYRERLGLSGAARLAVVVQRMVHADCAGVMFTKNPVDGRDERVVEGAWGLGEAVVAGLVDPDRARMLRGGEVVEHVAGDKDQAVRPRDDGDTALVPIEGELRSRSCLDTSRLAQLERLAARCEAVFDGAHDIEWAFEGEALFLLQRRPVTR